MFKIFSAVLYLGNVEFTEHADPSEEGKTIAQIATDESKYKSESSFDNVCALRFDWIGH